MSGDDGKMMYTHVPVLAEQTVDLLTGDRSGCCRLIDGTLGCGGHSSLILKKLPRHFCSASTGMRRLCGERNRHWLLRWKSSLCEIGFRKDPGGRRSGRLEMTESI